MRSEMTLSPLNVSDCPLGSDWDPAAAIMV